MTPVLEVVDLSICLPAGADRPLAVERASFSVLPGQTLCVVGESGSGKSMIATAILLESSLSFLGLGDPNQMSWGYMVGSARTVLRQAWWMALFPGLAIVLTVLALNLVGEGLNDGLNQRLDGRTK